MGLQLSSRAQAPCPSPLPLVEAGLDAELAFGKALLFRVYDPPSPSSLLLRYFTPLATSRKPDTYWGANETTSALQLGEISPSSLFTFHSRLANPVNYSKQLGEWEMVTFGSVVTIYANVHQGRYLDHHTFQFAIPPSQAREDSTRCEFVLRKWGTSGAKKSLAPVVAKFGDVVCLECHSQAGMYLQAMGGEEGRFQLSSKRSGFVLGNPTLSELLRLQARGGGVGLGIEEEAEDIVEDFVSTKERALARTERELWQQVGATLPVDLVRKILEFKPHYVQTARLCCKSWQLAVEREWVRKIRVNGEFYSFDTAQERDALVAFILRCQRAHTLTLRNILPLSDDNVRLICGNKSLRKLLLGGCRSLTDESVKHISLELPELRMLNLAQTSITDLAFGHLASLHQLQDLNLYHCSSVSAEGINKFTNDQLSLLRINLRGTVTHGDAIRRFSQRHPQVELLTGPASAEIIQIIKNKSWSDDFDSVPTSLTPTQPSSRRSTDGSTTMDDSKKRTIEEHGVGGKRGRFERSVPRRRCSELQYELMEEAMLQAKEHRDCNCFTCAQALRQQQSPPLALSGT
ncbi:hypothetical protein BASA81_003574 [Batrachochytrium salamandrivorans]|nr:hypothetical protein BASA81_003574 [Batrachochytrium salamandrivorans]